MGKSIGTCGHELPYEWEHSGAAGVAVKEYDREGRRAIAYRTVCRDCRVAYVDRGELLATEPQRQIWLRGTEPNQMTTRSPLTEDDRRAMRNAALGAEGHDWYEDEYQSFQNECNPDRVLSLLDEIERLRKLELMDKEGARLFAEGESDELQAIYDCDKCDLCEDHA